MRVVYLLLAIAISSSVRAADVYMAIVIDDLGNNRALGERAVNLPGPITFAVLPERPFSEYLAEQAHANGHELMLHQPMANHSAFPLGALGLTTDMPASERQQVLTQALASIPYVQGFNNHLGSLLTEDAQAMDALFGQRRQPWYFVDSVTTPHSAAYERAVAHGWPATKRDVFLDHEATVAFVSQQMLLATEIMERRGHALVIGHPYDSTLSYLELALPILQESGVQLLPVSEYIRRFGANPQALNPTVSLVQREQPDEVVR